MENTNKIILPNGTEQDPHENSLTSRAIERSKEDEDYIPVILKRTDESVRHPDDTLERAIEEGVEQYSRTNLSLFLSAAAAGLILGFTAMCVALVTQMVPSSENMLFNRLAVALVYPLGFIVCIMSGTQLFTEHTATAVYPVLDKRVHFKALFSLWIIILVGNMVGTFLGAGLIFLAEPVIQAKEGFIEVAVHLLHFSVAEVFISSILAGWLMAQGGWLVMATPPAVSQVVCIYIVTFIIGLGGLHHSIAGSAEIFSGIFHSKDPAYLSSFVFLLISVIGNLLGGSLFVGVLNYGHIRKTQ